MSLASLVSAGATENFDPAPFKIETAKGPVQFNIELARAPEERARGLMFRRNLADDAGMLFDFGQPQDVAMWMKNTYLPLDMLFIRADGTILRIEENTVPFSLDTIESGGPVRYVLEVIAGSAMRLGIRPGDTVTHPAIAAP